MANRGPELLRSAGDQIANVVDMVLDRVDVTLEYLHRQNGPIDKIYEKAIQAEGWLLDHSYDLLNKGRNKDDG